MVMDKEGFVISQFNSKKIGDDGAVIGELVYSKDLFIEDTHFKREWMSLEKIAKKSLLINISDAIAMNATPKYALIGVVLPSNFSKNELKKLSDTFKKECKKWNIEIIGGDTTSGEKLSISITIISQSKKPIFRKGMKEGDFIAHTGKVGGSLKDLRRLLRGGRVSKNSRFIEPKIRANFFFKAAPFIHSSMDISDGISKDLSRICKINNLGVKFLEKLSKDELCSGEEFELLFSFNPKNLKKLKNISKKTKTPFRVFAKATRGRYQSSCKEHHFKEKY
jgi:thiamine-monophosphate kinase